MTKLERLKNLCDSRGITINKLEQELDFSQGSLRKIDTNVPKADKIQMLADYFEVPMEYFMTEDEEQLKRAYEFAEWLNNEKPLYRVAAGEGAYNPQIVSDNIDMGYEEYQYAEIIGDSMLPELRNGDIVKIKPQEQTTPKDYTIVKVDGEHATCKFVEIVENGVWLRAINKEVFEDKFYSIQEVMTLPVTIIGKVVSVERKF